MTLKFTVETIEEETRDLTIYEEAVWCIFKNGKNDHYTHTFIEKCKSELDKIGLVTITDQDDDRYGKPMEGLFRIKSIRDATPEEIVAWYVLEVYGLCDNSGMVCNKCPLYLVRDSQNICCIAERACNAKKLLYDKNIIVTEVEE